MLDPGGRVIVALSGGGDSVWLLHLLGVLPGGAGNPASGGARAPRDPRGPRPAGTLRLPARSANGGRALYPAPAEDVPELAARRGLSLEEAGDRDDALPDFRRTERHALAARPPSRWPTTWTTARRPYLIICSGARGLRGLSGIAPVRGTVIRPLLCFRRQEIRALPGGGGHRICAVTPPTGSFCYARNRIRHVILPAAREREWPRRANTWSGPGPLSSEADGYFKRMAARIVDGECGTAEHPRTGSVSGSERRG